MKRIYWIEDNVDHALEIVNETYCRLWGGKEDEGVASTILFFGDDYKHNREDQDLNNNDLQLFNEKVEALLAKHCRNEEKWNNTGEMFQKKSRLIEQSGKLINNSVDESVKNVIKAWQSETDLQKYKSAVKVNQSIPEKLEVDTILEKMEIEKESLVFIDVRLLWGDLERVEKLYPTISMEFFRKLKKNNNKCHLYSSYTYDSFFIKEYEEIYKELFKEEIEIIREKDFFYTKQRKDILMDMIEKGSESEND